MSNPSEFPGSVCVFPINFSKDGVGRDEYCVYIILHNFESIIDLVRSPNSFLASAYASYIPPDGVENPQWVVDDNVSILFNHADNRTLKALEKALKSVYSESELKEFQDQGFFAAVQFEIESKSMQVHYYHDRLTQPDEPLMNSSVQPMYLTSVVGTEFAMAHFDIDLAGKDQVLNSEIKARLVYDMITNESCVQQYVNASNHKPLHMTRSVAKLGSKAPADAGLSRALTKKFKVLKNPTILIERQPSCPKPGEPANSVCDTMKAKFGTTAVEVYYAVIQDYPIPT